MLLLQGSGALSAFRIKKLRTELGVALPNAATLYAEHWYAVWFADSWEPSQQERSCLLEITRATGFFNDKAATPAIVVAPRRGTISPWSSKATDIGVNCGLSNLQRIERLTAWHIAGVQPDQLNAIAPALHDRMTETVLLQVSDIDHLHEHAPPRPLARIAYSERGRSALEAANAALGLALADDEIDYLVARYDELKRDPSDVELMMFAQANSEHCRHKIFNADWTVDGAPRDLSLFAMIRNTHAIHPNGVLSAYRDNAAVTQGYPAARFMQAQDLRKYGAIVENVDILMKVETHNHPTGISPFAGAATGAGGEIRDEGATGRGGRPKAGLTGFAVSHLRIPDVAAPWEIKRPLNPRLASALDIMLEGPIGAAAFNNEFGRPALTGYFRSFEQSAGPTSLRGYDKPIMLAGGLGNVRANHVEKLALAPNARIIVLGGPAMLIGLGGGAASSVDSGAIGADLDFASVQRGNAEMERRCQQVIDACWAAGDANPIAMIHDVGAGGLSNAIPEILHDGGRGGVIDLRLIPSAESALSPLEIWCNEAQERYVIALEQKHLASFSGMCARERCPYADVGYATEVERLVVNDPLLGGAVIDIPMDVIFGKPPRMSRDVTSLATRIAPFELGVIDLNAAVDRVLRFPGVGDKRFLITIGDRTVGGLVVRDQMVGPWQVPVADCAVTASGFDDLVGEAMALGERPPVALLDGPASARLAVGEALTNIASARIKQLSDVVLSANWMCPGGHPGEDARLYAMVHAIGMEMCPALGINIPVGKDSMSMQSAWMDNGESWQTVAPVSLTISAFARVTDVSLSLTPALVRDEGTVLLLIDLGAGRNRLGGSILAQAWQLSGGAPADCNDFVLLREFFQAIQALNENGYLLAYHDRSDGGLCVTLAEMAFAGRVGLDLDITHLGAEPLAALFAEELGAVVQIRQSDLDAVFNYLRAATSLEPVTSVLGQVIAERNVRIAHAGKTLIDAALNSLLASYSATTHALQKLRDNPDTADEELATILDESDRGLTVHLPQAAHARHRVMPPSGRRPQIAILREQGVNGHLEMAAAFTRAGFAAIDVHMTDILSGQEDLTQMAGLAVCGGFSYGDVLGAGRGWAGTIRFNLRARDTFEAFFNRPTSFTLGVCNGCQMLAHLADLIPGANAWPHFERNRSEQFEARLAMVEIVPSPSVLFAGLAGLRAPIAVAHAEGQATWQGAIDASATCLQYVDNSGAIASRYPGNPNGSPAGITGLTSTDGRATIMMPHPERVFLARQLSWLPRDWRAVESPWMALFHNARRWADSI